MRTFSIGRISAATGMLVLATAVVAGTGATPGTPEQHKAGAHGKDVYGIVNLEGGSFGFIADINARGQAAYEYFGIDGQLHVGFFDGTRARDISPPTNVTAFLGDLNDRGEVGLASSLAIPGETSSTPFRPFRWSAARGLVPLPWLGAGPSFVAALNNRSEIAGRSALSYDNGADRAVRWTAANRLTPLAAPAGIGQTIASDINDNNYAVGYGETASGGGNVLVWDPAGRPSNLGSFGGNFAFASHVNNRGDIAGMIDLPTPNISAFLWSPGKGAVRAGARTITHNLNDIGELVGRRISGDSDPAPQAFLFSRARGLVDLHVRGFYASEANDVNDNSVVVGLAQRTPGANIAYRWTRGGGAVDLNTRLLNPPAGLVVTSALAVNNNGDIIASSNTGVVLLRANGGGTDSPVLGPILHEQPRLNQPLAITLSFRDRNVGDTHTATVDWGDGSGPQAAGLREYRGKGELRATHTYTSEGDFNIVVRIRDSTGKATQLFERILVRELGGPAASSPGLEQARANALATRLRHSPPGVIR